MAVQSLVMTFFKEVTVFTRKGTILSHTEYILKLKRTTKQLKSV